MLVAPGWSSARNDQTGAALGGGSVAQTRRAPEAAVPAQMGAVFGGSARLCEAPPHDRPMTSAPRGGILRIVPGQTRMKTQDLVQTQKDPDGLAGSIPVSATMFS